MIFSRPVSGRVLDDVAPPHISASVESVSPIVQPRIPPLVSGTEFDKQSTGSFAIVLLISKKPSDARRKLEGAKMKPGNAQKR